MSEHMMTPRLDAVEAAAKDLLSRVKAPGLRADLELAVRDVEEARIWLRPSTPANEQVADLAVRAAEVRIAKVQAIVAVRGYTAQEAGG